MNLSRDEVAEMLRLRHFIIEAIENESWERLPPPVFVKGFVRSYARALDLDEKKVLDLYSRAAPPEPEILKPVAAVRTPDRVRALLFLLVSAALACVFYFWYVKASTKDGQGLSTVEHTVPVQKDEVRSEEIERVVDDAVQATLPATAQPVPAEQGTEAVPVSGNDSKPALEQEARYLTLEGFVKQRTWISIRVDGGKAKEFIFRPGDRPRWEASEGFEIVVGNAAGIDFEMDGKRMENLGRAGQVVRMRLPEKFKPTASEE